MNTPNSPSTTRRLLVSGTGCTLLGLWLCAAGAARLHAEADDFSVWMR